MLDAYCWNIQYLEDWRNVGVYLYVNCPNVKDFNNNIHTVNTWQLDSVHCGNVGTDIQRKVQ